MLRHYLLWPVLRSVRADGRWVIIHMRRFLVDRTPPSPSSFLCDPAAVVSEREAVRPSGAARFAVRLSLWVLWQQSGTKRTMTQHENGPMPDSPSTANLDRTVANQLVSLEHVAVVRMTTTAAPDIAAAASSPFSESRRASVGGHLFLGKPRDSAGGAVRDCERRRRRARSKDCLSCSLWSRPPRAPGTFGRKRAKSSRTWSSKLTKRKHETDAPSRMGVF